MVVPTLFLAPTFEGDEITDVMWGFPVYFQQVPDRVMTLVETDVVLNDTGMASVLLFSLMAKPIKHTEYVHPKYPE
jgi:hypothetical protein